MHVRFRVRFIYGGGDGQLGAAETAEIHLSIINGVARLIYLGSLEHWRRFVIVFLLQLHRQCSHISLAVCFSLHQ